MKKEFQSIQVLHFSLLVGSVFIFSLLYFGQGIPEKSSGFFSEVFKYVIPALLIGGILGGKVLGKTVKAQLGKEANLPQKLKNYRTRVILRCALLEGPTLLAIIIMYLTGNTIFILYAAAGWFALLFVRPSMPEFVKDYHISGQEEQEMMRD